MRKNTRLILFLIILFVISAFVSNGWAMYDEGGGGGSPYIPPPSRPTPTMPASDPGGEWRRPSDSGMQEDTGVSGHDSGTGSRSPGLASPAYVLPPESNVYMPQALDPPPTWQAVAPTGTTIYGLDADGNVIPIGTVEQDSQIGVWAFDADGLALTSPWGQFMRFEDLKEGAFSGSGAHYDGRLQGPSPSKDPLPSWQGTILSDAPIYGLREDAQGNWSLVQIGTAGEGAHVGVYAVNHDADFNGYIMNSPWLQFIPLENNVDIEGWDFPWTVHLNDIFGSTDQVVDATVVAFPIQVVREDGSIGWVQGGGIVYDEQYVITVAHVAEAVQNAINNGNLDREIAPTIGLDAGTQYTDNGEALMVPIGDVVEQVWIHPSADLAVIKLRNPIPNSVGTNIRFTDSVQAGEDLVIVRFSDGFNMETTINDISGFSSSGQWHGGFRESGIADAYIVVDGAWVNIGIRPMAGLDVESGDSGLPLYNQNGELVGIVNGGSSRYCVLFSVDNHSYFTNLTSAPLRAWIDNIVGIQQ